MNSYDSQDVDKGKVKYCSRCVISNKRPRIKFNKNNVCNACEYADYKKTQIDWQQRENYLLRLLDNYRSKNNSLIVLFHAVEERMDLTLLIYLKINIT